ncbi:MAG: serine hydrolase [Ferruginibacter sp.]|nr:serine hydrolase [Chitinophagaceae bacterium]
MKRHLLFLYFLLPATILCAQQTGTTKNYFPPAGKWEKQAPGSSGFDQDKLGDAIRFAISNESRNPRSMELNHARTFAKEPFGEAIGPFADRGDATGIIVHKGYIVAEWGEPSRVDMTHSVTKSFLSAVVGLAVDKGLIKNVNDTVAKYAFSFKRYDSVKLPSSAADLSLMHPFESPHNQEVTWESMLRQTSDWEGTLWDKPEWADRPDKDSTKWHNRIRNKPGAVFEYNDVRVNALALAATLVWRKSLPEVLKKNIMDLIGASGSWKWEGYRNSWIVLDGKRVQSVSGGGHWGGGMFINAYDMARFGLLTLHKGNWNGKQLISKKWIDQSLTPTPDNPEYGYMNFFLNTDKKYFPAAPATAFVHVGNGTNIIYVDTEHDLVVVVRWIENGAVKEMVKKVLEALK